MHLCKVVGFCFFFPCLKKSAREIISTCDNRCCRVSHFNKLHFSLSVLALQRDGVSDIGDPDSQAHLGMRLQPCRHFGQRATGTLLVQKRSALDRLNQTLSEEMGTWV